jgi:lipopolysaccharide/colanic/teichoic acid biosynthesis glycosyltransferase
MLLKQGFDIFVSFFGLLILWLVLLVVALLIKIRMPGGPGDWKVEEG